MNSDADQTLANTFGDDEDDTDVEDDIDDRQRLMRGNPPPAEPQHDGPSQIQSQSTSATQQRPATASASASAPSRTIRGTNDGVFANLAAKPERGEKLEDLPPVRISWKVGIYIAESMSTNSDI